MQVTLEEVVSSAHYFPLKFEGANLVFVPMSRESFYASSFTMPSRIITDSDDAIAVPFAHVVAALKDRLASAQDASFIFQVAHCGSTLLSKALDWPGDSLGIREPYILRQFASSPSPQNDAQRASYSSALRTILYLLSRRLVESERVVIKANVPVNYILAEVLEARADLSGVFLRNGFEDYILAALKAPERQQWAQFVVREMASKISQMSTFRSIDFKSLDAAQSAAVLWLSQIHSATRFEKLKLISSTDFFDNPKVVLKSVAENLAITHDETRISEVLEGDLFKRHAKITDRDYSEHDRENDFKGLLNVHSNQLEEVRQWCASSHLPIDEYV